MNVDEAVHSKVLQCDQLIKNGRPREALALAGQVVAQAPRESVGYLLHAQALRGTKEAVRWMEKALALAPEDAAMHHDYALALVRVGRTKEAFPHFERALQLDASNPHLLSTYALLLVDENRPREAEGPATAALRIAPDMPAVRYAAAYMLMGLKRFQQAEPHARRAVELAPEDFRSYEILGRLYARQGRLTEATNALRTALRLAPTDRDVQRAYAELAARKHVLLGAFAHAALFFGRLPRPVFWVLWFGLIMGASSLRRAGELAGNWPLLALGIAVPLFMLTAYFSPRIFHRGLKRGWFDVNQSA